MNLHLFYIILQLNLLIVIATYNWQYSITRIIQRVATEANGLPTLFHKQWLSDALLFQAPTSLVFICVENYVMSAQLTQFGLHNVNV